MLQKFTVTWQKVHSKSLPLSNQHFPKPTTHIQGLFKDHHHFQGLEALNLQLSNSSTFKDSLWSKPKTLLLQMGIH